MAESITWKEYFAVLSEVIDALPEDSQSLIYHAVLNPISWQFVKVWVLIDKALERRYQHWLRYPPKGNMREKRLRLMGYKR